VVQTEPSVTISRTVTDPEDTRDFDALPSFTPVKPRPAPQEAVPPEPDRAPLPPLRPPVVAPPRRRRRRSVAAGALAVAACLALGFVGGRLIGRQAMQAPEGPSASAPLPPADAGSEAPAAARVVIHYAAGSDADRQAAATLADELSRAGYGTIEMRSQTVAVGGDRIRYFEDSERGAAAALAGVAGRVLSRFGRPAPQLQDYTGFTPKPPGGTLEIWLGAG
jgi:hypothetical protein